MKHQGFSTLDALIWRAFHIGTYAFAAFILYQVLA